MKHLRETSPLTRHFQFPYVIPLECQEWSSGADPSLLWFVGNAAQYNLFPYDECGLLFEY